MERIEGCDSFGVGTIPASAVPFQSVRAKPTLRLGRPAADLPPLPLKLRIANHLASFRHVVQEAIRRGTSAGAFQAGTPLDKPLPRATVPLMLERVHQFLSPGFAFFAFLAEDGVACSVNILAEVVEVEPKAIQLRQVQLHLLANPRGAVDNRHALVGLAKTEPIGFTAHQLARCFTRAVGEGHVLPAHVLAVEIDDLELLPGPIGAPFSRRQRLAFLAATATFGLNLLPAFLLLRLGNDGNHHAVTAGIHPGHRAVLFPSHAAVLRGPGRWDMAFLLGLEYPPPRRFHRQSQLFGTENHLAEARKVVCCPPKTGRSQILATSHFQYPRRYRRSLGVEQVVGRRRAADLQEIPPAAIQSDATVDGDDVAMLPSLIGRPFPGLLAARRGEKRLPPH